MPKMPKIPLTARSHLWVGAISGLVGLATGAIALALTLHNFQADWLAGDARTKAILATHLEVSDSPNVSIIRKYDNNHYLYYITFAITAKNDSEENIEYSYQLFSADVLHMSEGGRDLGQGQLLGAPPDPFDGVGNMTPLAGALGLKWEPLTCVEYVNTSDTHVLSLLQSAGCENIYKGGGMTGQYGAHSSNSYQNGLLLVAKPGDFIGLSTAFGIENCGDEDAPTCSLSQEILRLPG